MANEVKFLITTDTSGAISGIAKFEDQVKKSTDNSTRAFTRLDAAVGSFFGNLAASGVSKAFAAISGGIGEVVNGFREFSSATAEVNSILPANQQLTEKTRQSFIAFANSFGTASQTQAKAFYGIVSAGVQGTAKQLATLEIANKAATAGLVDIDTAATALVSSVNAYAASGLTAQEASDSLFQAVKDGQTTFGELASSIGRVAPLAAAAGVSFTDLAGSLAFITKSGVSTDEAVTGIRSVLAGIVKPAEQASKAAQDLGINFSTAGIEAAGGFGNFLTDVIQKTNGSAEALGKLFPNVNALSTVLNVAGGNLKDFNDLLDGNRAAVEGATATQDAFTRLQQSADFQIQKFTNSLSVLPQAFLTGFEAPVSRAFQALNQFIGTTGIDLAVGAFQTLNNAIQNTRLFVAGLEQAFFSSIEGINNFAIGAIDAAIAAQSLLGLDTSGLEQTRAGLQANADAAREVAAEIENSAVAIATSQQKLNDEIAAGGESIQASLTGTQIVYEETARKKAETDDAQVSSEETKISTIQLLQQGEQERIAEQKELEAIEQEIAQEEQFLKLEEAFGREQALKEVQAAEELARQGKEDQAKQKLAAKFDAAEKKIADEKRKTALADEAAFFQAATSLASSENKTLAAIGKAAAITQIAIATPQAVASSFAFGASIGGPPLGFVFGAIAAAAQAAQAAKVAGISFQTGGIVPGQPSNRDNQLISVAGGEAVLNRGQQTNLFNAINSGDLGGGGGDNISINIEAGPAGVQDDQIDNLVSALNDRQEFGNATLETAQGA
jgi:TP901 family phage tail tape measure protein